MTAGPLIIIFFVAVWMSMLVYTEYRRRRTDIPQRVLYLDSEFRPGRAGARTQARTYHSRARSQRVGIRR
jgi:hypothetical protein